MSAVLDVLSAGLLVLGALLALTAAIALLRFPDTVARMHAATKPQTLGLLLVLVGTALRLGDSHETGMLVLAALFPLITAPVVAHRVGRLAYRESGVRRDLLVLDELAEDEQVRSGEQGS